MPQWTAVLNTAPHEYIYSWTLAPRLGAGDYGVVNLDHEIARRGVSSGVFLVVTPDNPDPEAVAARAAAVSANTYGAIPVTPRPPSLEDRILVLENAGGGPPPSGARYEHVQIVAAASWVVVHGMGVRPTSVRVLDPTGAEVLSDVIDTDLNLLTIVHAAPTTGRVLIRG